MEILTFLLEKNMATYTTVTLNCWNTEEWSWRRPILVDFVHHFRPNILCCQEVRPAVIEAIL